jgi:hypothetical protein
MLFKLLFLELEKVIKLFETNLVRQKNVNEALKG